MPGSVINLSDLLETCRDCTAPGSRPWDVSLWQQRIWGRVAGYPGYIRHLCLLSAGQHLSASLPHNKAVKRAGVGRASRSHGHRSIGPGKVQRLSPSLLDAVFHYLHMKQPWPDVSLPQSCLSHILGRILLKKKDCFWHRGQKMPLQIYIYDVLRRLNLWEVKAKGQDVISYYLSLYLELHITSKSQKNVKNLQES